MVENTIEDFGINMQHTEATCYIEDDMIIVSFPEAIDHFALDVEQALVLVNGLNNSIQKIIERMKNVPPSKVN